MKEPTITRIDYRSSVFWANRDAVVDWLEKKHLKGVISMRKVGGFALVVRYKYPLRVLPSGDVATTRSLVRGWPL